MSETEGTTTLSYLEFQYMMRAYNLCIKIDVGVRWGRKYASISNYVSSRKINKCISFYCSYKYFAKEHSNKH